MELFRSLWTVYCAVTVTVGVILSFILLSGTGLIWTFVVSAVAACAFAIVRPFRERDAKHPPKRSVVTSIVMVFFGIYSAAGWIGLLGFAVVPFALGIALASPWSVKWLRRAMTKPFLQREGKGTRKSGDARSDILTANDSLTVPVGPFRPVSELSDAELCRTWRGTYFRVLAARTSDELGGLCLLRGACLDELQRRDPAAFAAWIDSGARASGDPEKFYVQNKGHRGRDAA